MGMSADDRINAAGVRDKGGIAYIFGCFAEGSHVTEAYDNVAFFRPQQIDLFLGCSIGFKVLRRQEILIGDDTFRVASEAEDTYFQSAFAYDGVGLYDAFEGSSRKVIISAYDGELGGSKNRCEGVQTVVELMVSEGSSVVSHPVECGYLDTTMEEVEIGCALAEIAGIDEKQMFVQSPLQSYQAHAPGIAGTIVSFGFYLRMRIIRVQNRQMILGRASQKECRIYAA